MSVQQISTSRMGGETLCPACKAGELIRFNRRYYEERGSADERLCLAAFEPWQDLRAARSSAAAPARGPGISTALARFAVMLCLWAALTAAWLWAELNVLAAATFGPLMFDSVEDVAVFGGALVLPVAIGAAIYRWRPDRLTKALLFTTAVLFLLVAAVLAMAQWNWISL